MPKLYSNRLPDLDFSQEPDLKPLAKLPAFKKLIKEQNK